MEGGGQKIKGSERNHGHFDVGEVKEIRQRLVGGDEINLSVVMINRFKLR